MALPHMDLELEKQALFHALGVPGAPGTPIEEHPDAAAIPEIRSRLERPADERLNAQADAVRYVAERTEYLPVGMCIGPFSLMTKLLADPITPVYLAGLGMTAAEDGDIRRLDAALELAMLAIERSVAVQIEAGALAVFVAEPAANMVYLSPRQIQAGSDIFDRYVLRFNRRLKAVLDRHGCDLFFHCCGELTDEMVAGFASLDPAILSLGSSPRLWEDAALVSRRTVLYGNLPSKRFYSDTLVTAAEVAMQAVGLSERMRRAGHPFILGTECDVLSVPGCEATIMDKVMAFVEGAAEGIPEVAPCCEHGTHRPAAAAHL